MKKKSKLFFRSIFLAVAKQIMEFLMGMIVKSRPDWNPRQWSNIEIGKISKLFTGDVINVGAWKDGDKEGNYYREYFSNSTKYDIANYKGEDGTTGLPGEKYIDLSIPYDGSLGQYDLVFSHTVLEHVYPLSIAIDNICKLSRDSILIVVPFIQCFHGRDGSYGDYSRFTPMLLTELFKERGFEIVYMNWNDDFPVMNVYLIALASKYPDRFKDQLPQCQKPIVSQIGPGMSFSHFLWGDGSDRSLFRAAGEFVGSLIHVPRNW